MTTELGRVRVVHVVDQDPDLRHLEDASVYDDVEDGSLRAKYIQEDRKRLMGFGVTWNMMGVRSEAEILTRTCENDKGFSYLVNKVSSGSLYGIESDCDEKIHQAEIEELDELKRVLEDLGFKSYDIEEKISKADRSDSIGCKYYGCKLS